MIKLVNRIDFGQGVLFEKLKSESAVYESILSALFYRSDSGAAIGILDSNMTIAGDTDTEELLEFMRFSGPRTLLCECDLADRLGIKYTRLNVMRANALGDKMKKEAPFCEPKEAYSLLMNGTDGDISPPSYEAFCLDYSLRVRRGRAYGTAYKNSVCIASAVSDSSVIISGVATDSSSRGSGFGLMCVMNMRRHFADKECFVFCRDGLIPFYKKCGFVVFGSVAKSEEL